MRPLEATINKLCLKHLGRLPDLDNPKGFNDKIQWLKLHDQRANHIRACDKWAVRELVPDEYLIPAKLGFHPDMTPAYAKCTHDSGSSKRINDARDTTFAKSMLNKQLLRAYGADKGEWAYSLVPPRIITEKALKDGTDYKFHCVNGRVAWAQVMWDRKHALKEAVFTADGELTDIYQDQKMIHAPKEYPGDVAWAELTALAEYMSQGWRYVRVDMYWSENKAWFGEMTFWPRAGCQRSDDDLLLGDMMNIDLSEKLEPIIL